MKKIVLFLFYLNPSITFALDSITVKERIKAIENSSNQLHTNENKSPLGSLSYGIELNIIYILDTFNIVSNSSADPEEVKNFSGGFSWFDHKNGAEWAFPIFGFTSKYENVKRTDVIAIDFHYRKFTKGYIDGFYLSGFSRFIYINGPLTPANNTFSENDYENSSENKLGFGLGIGFRKFYESNIYWGMSFSAGIYIFGKNNQYYEKFTDENKAFFDIELFKLGYAF